MVRMTQLDHYAWWIQNSPQIDFPENKIECHPILSNMDKAPNPPQFYPGGEITSTLVKSNLSILTV